MGKRRHERYATVADFAMLAAMGIAQLNRLPVQEPPSPSTRRKPRGA